MPASARDLKSSVLRIVCANGITAGTGFIIAAQLAVTCAHMVRDAGSEPGQPIGVQFYGQHEVQKALVLSRGWSPPEEEDVAFLELSAVPTGVIPVVVGSSEQREHHPYTSFGYAPLGLTEARMVDGHLHGVVPLEQDGRALLQLDGNLVDKGLSGAPILDLETRRVVGMVTAFQNERYGRVAWATTMETLAALWGDDSSPAFTLWPDAYGPQERRAYLEHIIRASETLRLPLAYKDVPLERVYISLRADEMNREEREAERLSFDEVMERGQSRHDHTDPYTSHARRWEYITRHPTMFLLEARHWPRLFGEREGEPINVAELVQRHRHVVVLGDPGSGKTTVGKWLVLQHARAALQGLPAVSVAADQVQPGSSKHQPLDLGKTRLPIFLSMATLSKLDTTDLLATMVQYDCDSGKKEPEKLSPAFQALRRDALLRGEALVVLDGLDEVQNPEERRAMMLTIDRFLREPPPEATAAHWQENQALLTSRIVGYHYAPLIHLPHYTVEGMDKEAITAFCRAWMQHVAAVEASAVEEQTQRLQTAIFEQAHPGVRVLAANPLLLTILAQVYWKRPEHRLPATRAALFKQATQALFDQRRASWKQAGISAQDLVRALGLVAFDIHNESVLGLMAGGTVRVSLEKALKDWKQVEAVLEAAREVAGLLIEKGEGIYGFLHRSLQEYCVAQYFTAEPDRMIERMQPYLWNPAWREPLILAAGILSDPGHAGYQRFDELLSCFLETADPLSDALPRGALLVIAASAECERIPKAAEPWVERAAERLLAIYTEREGRGRSPILGQRIGQAFATLHQSSAKERAEHLLCRAIQSEHFDRRYGAIDLVIESEWASPALVNALLASWRRYAAPAGSMLTALFGIWERHPDLFGQGALPLRQVMEREPQLWDQLATDAIWRRILAVLYLPPGADFSFKNIYCDSPLTPSIGVLLRRPGDASALARFQQELRTSASQPGTPQARDAALVLSALGDASWIEACVGGAGEEESSLLPILAVFAFIYFPALDRALFPPRDFARDFDRDLAREIRDALQHALQPWRDDEQMTRHVENALTSLQTIGDSLSAENFGYAIFLHLLQACSERWPRLSSQHDKAIKDTSPLPSPITGASLARLVAQLASSDDEEREQARRTLETERQASVLSREVIEQMAAQALMHAAEPLVGTQLEWALHQIVHDDPVLMRSWAEQAQASPEQERHRAEIILSSLYRATPETFEAMLDLLPHSSHGVNAALLQSLRWQLRFQHIPEGQHERLQGHLLSWLEREERPDIRVVLIETLGHWQDAPADGIAEALLKKAGSSMSSEEAAALHTALACLASQGMPLAGQIRTLLQDRRKQPSAAAALTRLAVAEVWEKYRGKEPWRMQHTMSMHILAQLDSLLPDPQSRLRALLDAGTDDDGWEDTYHGVLALAAQHCIDHAHDPTLLALPLHRLQQALKEHTWPARRMMLAVLAACAETMPETLKRAAQSFLAEGVTLESLLVQGAVDAESHSSRRFALTAISYLGTVTANVVPALLAGCQDIAIVQRDAIADASRFKAIEGDLLTPLIEELRATLENPQSSMAKAYALVQVMAALGTSPAKEVAEYHTRITEALLEALKHPGSKRNVRLPTSFDWMEDEGSLEDALYTVLLQITEGWI